MRFLGIDLGWTTGASGLCAMAWTAGRLVVLDLDRRPSQTDCLAWIDHWAPASENALVAVDAPTLIPNATGMRLPDRLCHQYFRAYHAGSYPANLGRPFAAHTLAFGRSLEARGFRHAPHLEPQAAGRWQIEVFPHPAQVHLFSLPRILKYKKGSLAQRRQELTRLRAAILEHLPHGRPALIPPDLPAIPQGGAALKTVEDMLDSLICAYIAAHWWLWGSARNWVLGNLEQGYMVIPAPVSLGQERPTPPQDHPQTNGGDA
ncbi:MAG: DUF429 domain-containing protein [Gloeomargaritaceae cyanobacterium C42_A2020_066]|nr:DUF429 domain-containing protein [Gloeomargaritaceae cyanobacterium C42_A2020_066]